MSKVPEKIKIFTEKKKLDFFISRQIEKKIKLKIEELRNMSNFDWKKAETCFNFNPYQSVLSTMPSFNSNQKKRL